MNAKLQHNRGKVPIWVTEDNASCMCVKRQISLVWPLFGLKPTKRMYVDEERKKPMQLLDGVCRWWYGSFGVCASSRIQTEKVEKEYRITSTGSDETRPKRKFLFVSIDIMDLLVFVLNNSFGKNWVLRPRKKNEVGTWRASLSILVACRTDAIACFNFMTIINHDNGGSRNSAWARQQVVA